MTLRPLPLALVVPSAAFVVVAATIGAVLQESLTVLLLGMGLVALAALAYLSVWIAAGTFFALGTAASIFSRYNDQLGLPIGADRLLITAALVSLALGLPGAARDRTIVWRPVHAILGLTAAYATASALEAGTLSTEDGAFALLDRLGVVPFLAFILAPLLFGTKARRDVLLAVLTGTGLYLGITAVAEGTGFTALVFPKYILDESIGIHFGRARGPFAEAVANGLALYGCAVAAAVALATWTSRRARALAGLTVVLCLVGTIFTLTRAVWLATVVATALALLAHARLRALLGPLIVFGAACLMVAFAFVPGFSSAAEERSAAQRPLWDRYNTNRAAVSMVREDPLFGVGWQRFREESIDHFEVSPNYPLTGRGIEVHNVFLSHLAELGIVGAGLFTVGLLLAMGSAVIRPGPLELDPWRLGTVALFVHWFTVASFGPLSYAFPNLLLWLWAGVAAAGHTSEPVRTPPRTAEVAPVG